MNEQMVVNQAVDRYHKLDEALRSQILKDEETAFLRGRKFELMLTIYALDKAALAQLTESPLDTKPEIVSSQA